jgi:hypothetical protein
MHAELALADCCSQWITLLLQIKRKTALYSGIIEEWSAACKCAESKKYVLYSIAPIVRGTVLSFSAPDDCMDDIIQAFSTAIFTI